MSGRFRRTSPERGNVPGNPLRSYRMSMLAHGFVEESERGEFALDDSDPVTYSVVRLRGKPLTAAACIAFAVVIVAAVIVMVIAG